ncbi:MAG: serine/threonine protein kinase [Bradymonadaceae bacterium]|nr:serine/threonine protein kinase [Lujinxingiaceae bacterium]
MTEILRHLGRYELCRRIAAGGMGEIFVAKSRGAGGFEKTVIIKTILPHLAEEQEFVTKFLDEGRIVVNLTHGNIVPVFDMGEENGEYFIAMEYVPGRDLREVLRQLHEERRAMPVELALHITAELAKGLAYAHRKTDADGVPLGIVHRDVSPSNVLISREGEVKLIDFGIARATGKISKTMSGRIQGKCCYMSPEQAAGRPVDARGDIFAAGVLLYELLTGCRPFEGDSDLETLEMVRVCAFDAPSILNHEVSDELDAIVARALAREPEQRYQSIDELQIAVTQQLYGNGYTVTSRDVATFLEQLFPKGVEPDVLRKARNSASSGPLDLDAALNLELDRLDRADATPSQGFVDPHLATAPALTTPVILAQELLVSSATPSVYAAGSDKSADPGTGSGTGSVQPVSTRPANGFKRWLAIAVALGLVIGAVAAIATWGPQASGMLTVESEPAGARILINGAQLVGVATPHTLALPAGTHNVQLSLEGYVPKSFTLELERRQELTIFGADARLTPVSINGEARRFEISTRPSGAALVANGMELGIAPQKLSLGPQDVVNLVATHPDCDPGTYTLSHSHATESIVLTLKCADSPVRAPQESVAATQETPQIRTRPIGAQASKILVTFDSVPTGATVEVNGAVLGRAPIQASFAPDDVLNVRGMLAGHTMIESTRRASSIPNARLAFSFVPLEMGCLDFRALEPAHNELAINGRWLEGRRMMLKAHPLPAGNHTITVRNPDAKREETFSFNIEPGSRCTYLGVWKPER